MKAHLSLLFLVPIICLAQSGKRTLMPGDVYRQQSLGNPVISPEGQWVAYTISSIDSVKDKRNNDVWMVSWDGKQNVQLTSSTDNESNPKWSPDGKYLSFVAARQGGTAQVWLLDRRGGEGIKLTDTKGAINNYSWSPDSKKLLLEMKDPADTSKNKKPQPYVINKFKFKQDVRGYLYDSGRTHLYVYDIASKNTVQVTSGIYEETDAAWSPDGNRIAFVSNRTAEPEQNVNTDIWIVEPKKDADVKRLTTWTGADGDPQWSPDGKTIAYIRSTSNAVYEMYDQGVLCVINASGGEPRTLSAALDRPVSRPAYSANSNEVAVLVADDCQRYILVYELGSGSSRILAGGNRSYAYVEAHQNGNWLATMSEPQLPAELYVVEKGTPRRLTTLHQAFIDPLQLASVEKFTSTSKDGTKVSGLLYYPPNRAKKNLPLILFIHGGPTAQDEFSFDMTRQMLAAKGYAVAAVNYRGSLGRGIAFSKVISGDWGNKEVLDILGATDYLVQQGIADPKRLGIGGWSYGGILTNYTIASDTRFKAASSGAGVAMPLSLFGVDQYVMQYVHEIGLPWKDNNFEKYTRLSYPFLHADRITTPTQFLVGENDFKVPAVGSEQMYQALRSLNVPTELLIYPGQFHGFSQPSFIKDRFERYYTWFDRYLRP